MSNMNPQTYYENEENHGSYVYVSLEEMVNNFMLNYVGDSTVLGKVPRSKIIYHMKQGVRNFSFNALKEIKAVELSLNDTLDIILPPDYVNFVRISYVNETTGQLMTLGQNNKIPQTTSYLQDNGGEILFDDNGNILEGTAMVNDINDNLHGSSTGTLNQYCFCGDDHTNWKLDTSVNANGTFNINERLGKIHFSSDNAIRTIVLEYISDGLEYSSESDIRINKLAEQALYHWTNWQLLNNKLNVQEYIISRANKNYHTAFRNSKIALMKIRVDDIINLLGNKKKWFK